MNIQQWLTPLLKMASKQMRPKKKSNGMWWASMIGLALGLIALIRKAGTNKDSLFGQSDLTKGLVHNTEKHNENKPRANISDFLTMQDRSVLAEFSNELTTHTDHNHNEINKVKDIPKTNVTKLQNQQH